MSAVKMIYKPLMCSLENQNIRCYGCDKADEIDENEIICEYSYWDEKSRLLVTSGQKVVYKYPGDYYDYDFQIDGKRINCAVNKILGLEIDGINCIVPL